MLVSQQARKESCKNSAVDESFDRALEDRVKSIGETQTDLGRLRLDGFELSSHPSLNFYPDGLAIGSIEAADCRLLSAVTTTFDGPR